jgi:spore coat polysaccharide biosynthesis protein SpsF
MPTAIIQARMSSSRLPGKVLQDIAGQPMLVHVVERARRAHSVERAIIATTTDPSDDGIQQLCNERGYLCFRGSMPDVLDRYYQTAREYDVKKIVRLTADCPLLDPGVLDLTVKALATNDFAANRLPPPWSRSLPIGLDVEVVTFAALERAWNEAHERYHREHVLPYVYENAIFSDQRLPVVSSDEPGAWWTQKGHTPRGFRLKQLHHSPNYGTLRWTVDTAADLELVRKIYTLLSPATDFSWRDVLALFERQPELALINAEVVHKTAFDTDKHP